MNKSMKPAGFQPRVAPAPKPLTEEDKKIKVMQFVQQKREAFAINILRGLCTNMGKDATNKDAKDMVALSVEMADALFEKLYPLPEEKENEKSNN